MAVALAAGFRNLGLTWPNPSVGAVLVSRDKEGPVILSEGATAKGGRPHAERLALDAAGEKARGATLYVTLEPCAHMGRASPCADAIIAAGVGKVVAGILDPDLRVAGQGFTRICDAGIEVVTGVLADEARRLHCGHLSRVLRKRPSVTVKLARTRDGFAAGTGSERLMITGEVANNRVHMMRAHTDAVLVGVNTANADNPRLDVRLPGMAGRSPVRVILDSNLSLNPELTVVTSAVERPTWVVTAVDAPAEREEKLRESGVDIMRVARLSDGRLDPVEALERLLDRGISNVFCEGGPTLASALAGHGLVDSVALITGAAELGTSGLAALSPEFDRMIKTDFTLVRTERAGHDEFAFYERND